MRTNFGHLAPQDLTPLMVGGMVATWKTKLRKSTIANYGGKLMQLLRVLAGMGAPRISLPKLPKGSARAITATPQELARLMETPAAWLKLYLLLYFQCGLRRAETLRVTARSWNPEQHTVTLEVKGGGVRTAQLTPEVEDLLAAANPRDPDQSFIEALHGKPITAAGLQKAWQKHKKNTGVNPALYAHDLRRTAATLLYHATKDLRVPQQLLGHKNLASTLDYLAPLAPDEARRYAELLRFDKFHSGVKQ